MEYCFRPVLQDAATIMDECEADLQDQEPSTVCPIEDAFSDQVDNLFDQSFGDIFCSDLKEGVKEDKGKDFDLFDEDVFNDAFHDAFNDEFSSLDSTDQEELSSVARFEEMHSDAFDDLFDPTFEDISFFDVKKGREEQRDTNFDLFEDVFSDYFMNDFSLF